MSADPPKVFLMLDDLSRRFPSGVMRSAGAELALHSHGMTSELPWSRIGTTALGALSDRPDLWLSEEWFAGGCLFVALRRA